MKIKVVQFAPIFGNKLLNEEYILSLCEKANDCIIVFPELATSGYFFLEKSELKDLSYNQDSNFWSKVKNCSKKNNLIIVIGYPELSGELLYNSSMLILPNGVHFNYRKSHLFYKEKYIFESGNTGFNIIEYKPWDIKIGLMICYDWRFPEVARTLALKGADLIICPSNLVTDLWYDVMKARAIENKVFLAVANRIGTEMREINSNTETLEFKGKSVVLSPIGERLVEASHDLEETLTVEIEPNLARNKSINSENDILADRREDLYFK